MGSPKLRRAPAGVARGRRACGTQVQKALEQSATMGAGRWGEKGREREERGTGEHSTQHKSTQQGTNNTRRRKGILHGGNPKVGEGRSPDISQGGVEGLYIQ